VLHQAAIPSVPRSVQDPITSNRANIDASLNVLVAARDAGVRRLVYAGSSSAYGDTPTLPKVETMGTAPRSPYALQKLVAEQYCQMFTRLYGLETVTIRYFNVFGPRQDPKSQYAAAVPIFVARAVKHEPITIFGDGEQTRDFVYVKDIAAANAFFATQSSARGVFNVAYGQRITIKELAAMICHQTESRSEILHATERPGDVKHSLAAIEKLRAAGFAPTSDFAAGLRATVEFFERQAANRVGN
jgi:UDP-glucose 4-epimerase